MSNHDHLLQEAISGDINAFQALFAEFQAQLKSYLYRLVTDRNDAEDLTHDTFVKAFDKIGTFQGKSSLKTWVFRIATNIAYDHLRRYKRWETNTQDLSKEFAHANKYVQEHFREVRAASVENAYEIREHIDFCFTCISKTLLVEKQVALILKDVYQFSVKEIAAIIEKSEGVVKHLLVDARKIMMEVYDKRCALINKNGTCNQCSELNGVFNPKQDRQKALMEVELARESSRYDREALYTLRTKLVSAIDPLRSKGSDIEEAIMWCTRKAVGEIA